MISLSEFLTASSNERGPNVPVWVVNTGFLKDTATCDCAARLYV